ncbi:MAG: Flp pilus assembly protein TadG [Paracoccaceae bacterium]|jgi:Flp pilus assembly protein TadG
MARYLKAFRSKWHDLWRDRGGASLIELGFAMPILVTLLLGGVEIARYVLLHQKLDRVSSSIADLVSQAENISVADLQNIFDAAQFVAKPFNLPADGTVIVSSISNPLGGQATKVNWQQAGAGSVPATSQIGTPGGSVTLPTGFVVADGQTIIIAEVFYDYEPWILGEITGAKQIYHRALFRPRYGGLTTLAP